MQRNALLILARIGGGDSSRRSSSGGSRGCACTEEVELSFSGPFRGLESRSYAACAAAICFLGLIGFELEIVTQAEDLSE